MWPYAGGKDAIPRRRLLSPDLYFQPWSVLHSVSCKITARVKCHSNKIRYNNANNLTQTPQLYTTEYTARLKTLISWKMSVKVEKNMSAARVLHCKTEPKSLTLFTGHWLSKSFPSFAFNTDPEPEQNLPLVNQKGWGRPLRGRNKYVPHSRSNFSHFHSLFGKYLAKIIGSRATF